MRKRFETSGRPIVRRGVCAVAAAFVVACLDAEPFECETDAQCNLGGDAGLCQVSGYCAYPDEECPPPGLRYSLDAPDELAGQCAP
jgi:hypothetical protein